ncbi:MULTISPECIES: GNAT family N-acetyltransferase [Pseudomonas]|uniref:GNAT family N-acetyltransferase n=1 Tax=Pseudomonas yamanorum TaxID=515393 RepID=A0A7Y8JQY0_9PSED|nr:MULTISPECIES: GNAT family N-acetyltransferase [Pseudomonas]MDF3199083.1 GNAT family N-acetyltransferase [Pseudomonas sp. 1912-s]NWE14792.1 GNAT family N-acetyltransferase [Pseudomonas yamanorum]
MDICSVQLNDLPKLLQLYLHLTPGDNTANLETAAHNIATLQKLPGSTILAGWLDRQLIATCTLVVIPNLTRNGMPYALIENVVTHPDYRNEGCGKAILAEAVKLAWEADCYKVMLLTGSERPAVHSFYLSAGFEQNKTGFQIRRIPINRV